MDSTFRIFVTNKDIKENIGILRGCSVLFINDKDFYHKVKSGELSVKNKVIMFVEKSYTSVFKKLIDDNYIQLEIRGIDKQKFMKLEYSTSLLDNSKYMILDPYNEIERNKKIILFTNLDYNSENNNSLIPYKLINKKYFVDNYDEIIESLGDGDLSLDFESHGLETHKVDSGFEIIGIGFCSNKIGYYVEFRNDQSIDDDIFKEKYRQFIKNNNHRLWTYYCNFEIMVNYWYLGEFIELQDSMALCIADENSGSLKYASQYYLKSIDWESETSGVKEGYIKDIYNSLPDDKKEIFCSNIMGDVTQKKLLHILNQENNDKFNPLEYDFYPGEYESYKEKYISSDGSTISYLPSKVVSKYCIYDCYNTLRIKELLYDKYKTAYDCFIKNIYLSIPLQNHGLLLDHVGLEKVSNKYEYILYNLEILIAKFYYTYSINNIDYKIDDLLTSSQLQFFKSYGILSTFEISKKIVNDCINKDIVGYLDYTSLYENIINEELRNKIILLLDSYKSDESLLKGITASSKIIKEINSLINGYDDSLLDKVIDQYFSDFIIDYDKIKPKTDVQVKNLFKDSLNDKHSSVIPEFNGYYINDYLTNELKSIINIVIKSIDFQNLNGKDLFDKIKGKKQTKTSEEIFGIKLEFNKILKNYRDKHDNVLSKLDRSIKRKTINDSKQEFMKLLETYFTYELVVKYKIGDNFYDKKTRESYFKLLTRLELNDYILVNSCNNQEELDDIDDLTEDQKYKYSKIKFQQSFLNEYENIYEKSLEFYNVNIQPLLKDFYRIEDIINKLLENNLLQQVLFDKSISKEFDFIDYKNIQFNLEKVIKYYNDKDTLELLNSINIIDILENDNGIRQDIKINLVTPANKQIINKCLMDNYKNIIYNFHKIYKTGKFDLSQYDEYNKIVKFLESNPDADDIEINTYVKKTFNLLPQMRTLKYYYDKDQIELIDTSFNNDKSFDECAKLMYCINLYYKLDKVYTSYIHGNVIAKNTYNYSHVNEQGFSYLKQAEGYKITQSQFKMLSLKTKRSSAGIHTLNKRMEPTYYLHILKDHIGIYFDLSAAEVRAAAFMSGDKIMIELFESGVDIYNWMRQELSELIDRDGYKAIVLGLIYGRSTDSIAKSLGHLNPEIVVNGIEMFKNTFWTLWKFIEKQTDYCIENGKINTMLGDLIDVSNYHKSKRSTVGMNYSVQGYTASLVAEGGYNVWKQLYNQGLYIRLINLVHDSLSYSVHSKDFFTVYNKLQELFIDYLEAKYRIHFKFDLDLFLLHSDKTSVKKIDETTYEFNGDKSVEIFERLNKFNNLELVSKEIIEDNRHIYQVIDNDKFIKIPQNMYIANNFKLYNKSKVIIKLKEK